MSKFVHAPLKRAARASDRTGIVSFFAGLLRSQDGIAMPVVTGAMALVLTLAAGVAATSLETNDAVNKDRSAKQAQGAAEAGLQLAYLAMSQAGPGPNDCVTDGRVPIGSATECPSFTVDLGNGVRTSYVVATPASGACPVIPGREPQVGDRCITATGHAGGVRRRLQARVNLLPGFKPWATVGLLAKKTVSVDQNGTWITNVGANETVMVGKTTINGSAEVPEDGQVIKKHNQTVITGGTITRDSDWEFPDVEQEPYELLNDNDLLATTGFYTHGSPDVNDGAGPTRAFVMPNNTTLTMQGGTYSFCSFLLGNNVKIRIPVNAVVRIFIDSPDRDKSSCTGGGTIDIPNTAEFNKDFGMNPAQLEIYVHGREEDSIDDPDVDLKNDLGFYGTIYAPNSYVNVNNNADMVGGIVGENIDFKNGAGFTWPDSIRDKELPGAKGTVKRGWFECSPDPTVAGDPESGCTA